MATLKILTFPDKFLNQPTKEVENIDGKLQGIIDDMAATMYDAPGIGLAAIQVGIDKSILIFDVSPRDDERCLEVLVNPRIVTREGKTLSENEGCLSVPDYRADVKRALAVQVKGVDREGNPVSLDAEGLLAVVLQHEIDHLNGVLFIDHISPLKRTLYKKRVKKQLKLK
ncbi:MAG: peptide deformylase [Deltaproteobacteria bacterium]|nr:peptide deformylase [Deltaproteobacteria bacterium]